MDEHQNNGAVGELEAEVARARLSFEEGLREASVVGTRAARRVVTPALIGLGLAGGALLVLTLVRLARRPPADAAWVRIVVEPPRTTKRVLPALGGAVARWLFDRQMRNGGPLAALASAAIAGGQRALRERARSLDTPRTRNGSEPDSQR
jgi:hypothetical protein